MTAGKRMGSVVLATALTLWTVLGGVEASPAAALVELEYKTSGDLPTPVWIWEVPSDCTNHPANGSWGYGSSCFRQDGDEFYIMDEKKDSQSVAIVWKMYEYQGQWEETPSRRGICINPHGHNHIGKCNYNFPETGWILYRMTRCNGSAVNCHYLDSYTDWTAWKRMNVAG